MRARVSGGTWTSLPRGQRSSKPTRPPPVAGRNAAAADVLATANLTVASEPQAAKPPVMLFQEKPRPPLIWPSASTRIFERKGSSRAVSTAYTGSLSPSGRVICSNRKANSPGRCKRQDRNHAENCLSHCHLGCGARGGGSDLVLWSASLRTPADVSNPSLFSAHSGSRRAGKQAASDLDLILILI